MPLLVQTHRRPQELLYTCPLPKHNQFVGEEKTFQSAILIQHFYGMAKAMKYARLTL